MERFVRFRSNLRSDDYPRPLGVFYAAGKLMESEALDPWSAERAKEICEWFNRHLKAPRLPPRLRHAVFWFRAERRDLIQRLWELALLLQEQGTAIELVHTTRPGRVRYADEFQVAAIPWRR
jgi:hypothetical protein